MLFSYYGSAYCIWINVCSHANIQINILFFKKKSTAPKLLWKIKRESVKLLIPITFNNFNQENKVGHKGIKLNRWKKPHFIVGLFVCQEEDKSCIIHVLDHMPYFWETHKIQIILKQKVPYPGKAWKRSYCFLDIFVLFEMDTVRFPE